MTLRALRNWWDRIAYLTTRPRAERVYRRGRSPGLEVLEDRNLPSTFTVNHLADDLVGSGLNGSLRYCLNQAANGDTITFGVSGTITLGGNELDITKSLDIEGPGADQLAISGNPSPILASRVFG